MKKPKIELSNPELKKLSREMVNKAKERKLIKPISEAFKNVPTDKEVHEGKEEYFL